MQSTPDAQVKIRASRERLELRSAQERLNRFLWASELAYSALLSGQLATSPDGASVDQVLAEVPARSWNMSHTGRSHYYRRNVGNLRSDLREATARVSGAVLTSWLSEFDCYLSRRIRHIRRTPWGPYSLWIPKTLDDRGALIALDDVLRADVWRMVRNMIVHEPGQSRDSLDGEKARNPIVSKLVSRGKGGDWTKAWNLWGLSGRQIEQNADKIVADTLGVAQIKAERSGAPAEPFCCVFSFTSVDTLAHRIEEVTLPARKVPGERTIKIRSRLLRRRDLQIAG
jgi:hypothetical protein